MFTLLTFGELSLEKSTESKKDGHKVTYQCLMLPAKAALEFQSLFIKT